MLSPNQHFFINKRLVLSYLNGEFCIAKKPIFGNRHALACAFHSKVNIVDDGNLEFNIESKKI